MQVPRQVVNGEGAGRTAPVHGGARWSWAAPVFLAMEATWLHAGVLVASSPLARAEDPLETPALSLAGIVMLLGGAYTLGIALRRSSLDFAGARVAQAVAAVVAISLVVTWETGSGDAGLPWPLAFLAGDLGAVGAGPEGPRRLLGLLIGALLWWRGTRLSSGIDVERTLFSFTAGVAAMTVSLLALHWRPGASGQGPLALPFLALGLLALAAAHLERLRRDEGVSPGRHWLGLPVLVAAATLGVGWAAARLVGGETQALAALGWVLLRDALLWVAYPLLLALGLLAGLLISLLQLLTRNLVANIEQPEVQGFVEELESQMQAPVVPAEWIGVVLRLALVAALLGVFLLLVAWALGRRGESAEGRGQEERDSVFSASQLWRRLAGLLSSVFASKRQALWAAAQPAAGWEERTMRRLYRLILAGAARRGVARSPTQTPDEFQRDLDDRLRWAQLRPVTTAFVASRYGGLHPTRARLGEMERLWREVRGASRIQNPKSKIPNRRPCP
ncbi:MAG: DUF4129 domain-containing protein [Chloroflexi bacterium]|nr:DUF4129 domain-containing protein [Chloroflexota bacterium]